MDALPVDYDPFGMVPVEHNPFVGDPEAAGAAAASSAMEPTVAAHFAGIGQDLAQRIGTGDDGFPLERAMSVALGVGPGAIRAYHGSPYDFEAFDPAKIGTGEGAQVYGHGLYFAENPGVAEQYQKNVRNMPVIDAANQRMSEIAKELDQYRKPGTLRDFTDPRGDALAEEYDRLMAEKTKPGRMYEVQLHADPDEFLHWDKPLSEQHQRIQDFFADPNGAVFKPNMTGAELYRLIDEPGTSAAADAMHRAGIPGIRYLDQGSRSATGKPTHNFVMFDPSLIEIARKYGVPGLIAGGAASAGGSNADAADLIPVDHDPFAGAY